MNKRLFKRFFFSTAIVLLIQGVSPTLSNTENAETIIFQSKQENFSSQKKQLVYNSSLANCTPKYFQNREKIYPIGHVPFTPISIIDLKQAFLL